jgi:hypothetical protein
MIIFYIDPEGLEVPGVRISGPDPGTGIGHMARRISPECDG